ncbi:MAG: ABC transporter permease [Methanobrevibacter sp.]|jgi:ABC-2 type transport system permease protein|nr:ABC transporter permease [Candidatus Methanovirga aequatorialis]
MNKTFELIYVEFKGIFRIPIILVFSIILPQLLLFAITMSTKNSLVYGNNHFVDIFMPSIILMVLLTSGITNYSIGVTLNRSRGIWQTFFLKGFKLYEVVISHLFVYMMLALIGTVCVIFSGRIFFSSLLPSFTDLIILFIIWLLSAIVIFMIGFCIGCFSKSEKVTQPVSTTLMFILMFTSGVFTNIKTLPFYIQDIVNYLPSTQIYYILFNHWTMTEYYNVSWWILIIWIIFLIVIIIWKLKKDDLSRT